NATPVWGIAPHVLTDLAQASDAHLWWLGRVDMVLLGAMWLLVGWAFGWRPMCTAMIFWGTNYAARYFWNGGALLRMDWLFFSIAGVCLMKKDRPFAAGAALATATLLRIFPGFIVAALVVKAVAASLRARKLVVTPAQRRFFVGAAAAIAILMP